MTELHNPLFEDEREFLERQKLEYERALMGDVQNIKDKTRQVSKYAAIGAGVLGSVWLISKAFGGSKSKKKHTKTLKAAEKGPTHKLKASASRPLASTTVDTAVADDASTDLPLSGPVQIDVVVGVGNNKKMGTCRIFRDGRETECPGGLGVEFAWDDRLPGHRDIRRVE